MILFNKDRKTKEQLFEDTIIAREKELYKLAFYYVKNENDALDILQESILKAFKSLNKLQDVEAIDKWIKRIVINTAVDFIRKNSKVTVVEENEMVNLSGKVENNQELGYCIDDLQEDLKAIIVLKYFHGYTINEVAEILDISVSQVKNKLHKALKLLRVDMKEEYYGPAVL